MEAVEQVFVAVLLGWGVGVVISMVILYVSRERWPQSYSRHVERLRILRNACGWRLLVAHIVSVVFILLSPLPALMALVPIALGLICVLPYPLLFFAKHLDSCREVTSRR